MATDREQFRRNDKGRIANVPDLSDLEDAANKLHQRHLCVKYGYNADGNTNVVPIMYTDRAIRVVSAKISATTLGAQAATNDINYITISLEYDDGAGGSDTAISTTGLSNSSTTRQAATARSFTISSVTCEVAANKQLLLKIAKTGTGAVATEFLLDVLYQEI